MQVIIAVPNLASIFRNGNALILSNPCEYCNKYYTTKNWMLWATFLLHKVLVYLQPLLCNPPQKLPNCMKILSR